MINITSKSLGTKMRTTAFFKNTDRVTIIPDVVTLSYKTPSAVLFSQITLPDMSSNYVYDVLLDEPGTWYFRWSSTGDYASSDEFGVFVSDTKVK